VYDFDTSNDYATTGTTASNWLLPFLEPEQTRLFKLPD
jgi:hypothetical protein